MLLQQRNQLDEAMVCVAILAILFLLGYIFQHMGVEQALVVILALHLCRVYDNRHHQQCKKNN